MPEYFYRAVRAAAVHHNVFYFSSMLIGNTAQGALDELALIERRSDDANFHMLPPRRAAQYLRHPLRYYSAAICPKALDDPRPTQFGSERRSGRCGCQNFPKPHQLSSTSVH